MLHSEQVKHERASAGMDGFLHRVTSAWSRCSMTLCFLRSLETEEVGGNIKSANVYTCLCIDLCCVGT